MRLKERSGRRRSRGSPAPSPLTRKIWPRASQPFEPNALQASTAGRTTEMNRPARIALETSKVNAAFRGPPNGVGRKLGRNGVKDHPEERTFRAHARSRTNSGSHAEREPKQSGAETSFPNSAAGPLPAEEKLAGRVTMKLRRILMAGVMTACALGLA